MNRSVKSINHSGFCTGCQSCFQKCPARCITMKPDAEGFLYPEIDPSACRHCQVCSRVCPYSRTAFHLKTDLHPRYAAARLKDPDERKKSSSGGVFFAVSEAVLRQEGAVAGTEFTTSWTARLEVTTQAEVRDRFRLSKYVQSRNDSAYRNVEIMLKEGRKVLFSGTPCQVAGLYAFLGGDPVNLYTMDFICHGTPSPAVFDSYLKALESKFGAPCTDFRFRDKNAGWTPMRMTVKFKNGAEYSVPHEKDPYFLFFLAGGMNRPSCVKCPYTRPGKRESDLTLGDGWRAGELDPAWRDNSGISSLLINTAKGRELLDAASSILELHDCQLASIDQGYLHKPASPHPDRTAFFRDFRKYGAEPALRKYMGPRPFLRRVRSRLLKIWTALTNR